MNQTILAGFAALVVTVGAARGQSTAFTYQGALNQTGNPASGLYDFQFTLLDALSGGNTVGSPVVASPVGVTNGLFTVTLDFGPAAFSGAARWLEIGVRTNGGGSFATLAPRQKLTPTPYAIFSGAAATAASATTALTAPSFTGPLAGDVTGAQGATVVANVGGQTAGNVASGANAANAATSASTPSTIVKRDGSGNFTAGTVTGNLSGNATTATSANSFSGSLAGDVTGTQGATVVASVGGQSAGNVAGGASAANAATSANTANTIPKRDGSGKFFRRNNHRRPCRQCHHGDDRR